jgi:hypothetical protein
MRAFAFGPGSCIGSIKYSPVGYLQDGEVESDELQAEAVGQLMDE